MDPVFKIPDDEKDHDAAAKQWAHQIDKFFSPYETVKLPYSFGDYLVMALDEEYRKQWLVELDRKRRTIIGEVAPEQGDILLSLQNTIKQTNAPCKNREEEIAKARARTALRFPGT